MAEIIDFHTHFLPRLYAQALKKHIPGDPDGWPTPGWDEHLTLAFMKKESYWLLNSVAFFTALQLWR